MNEHRLSNCLENIDPRFIDEAADYKKKSRGRGVYYFAAALAACVLLVIAAKLRPAGVADPGLTAVPPDETAAASSAQGVYVPAIELPEAEPGVAMDMIACVVYEGTVYTQGEWPVSYTHLDVYKRQLMISVFSLVRPAV